mmetsp:Transcript_43042/g.136020  ORF Transcript_43042/g.136020 Transcript_43042/m.136020 type:complete len:299 (-) Transcript_43042:256-1152(-)
MLQAADPADSFSRRTRDTDRVDGKLVRHRNSENSRERAEDDAIGVLEEHNVLDSAVLPRLGDSSLMHQRVDIPVSVRLCLDLSILDGEMAVAVLDRRHLVLLHDGQLRAVHAEVVVVLEELLGHGMSVITCHDGEGDLLPLPELLLDVEDVGDVQLQEALRLQRIVQGERNLDALVSQPLPKASSNEHEACLRQSLPAQLLHPLEVFRAHLQVLSLRHRGGKPLVGVHSLLRVLEELAGVGDVSLQPSRQLTIQLCCLLQQLRLLLLPKALKQMPLSQFCQPLLKVLAPSASQRIQPL